MDRPAPTATTRVVWELMRAAIILYSKPEVVWRIDLAQIASRAIDGTFGSLQ
jgi:hypothetical protein